MEQPVVVGVDGSDPSWEAVDWAADEAARHGCTLHIVHASRWERYEDFPVPGRLERPSARVVAENIVAAAEHRATTRQPNVKVTGGTSPRDPVEALVEEGTGAFAVVVGSRGHGAVAGTLLGSVSMGVAGRATCPTIVVRAATAEGRTRRGDGDVVLGVEGDKDAEGSPAIGFAMRAAEARGCGLTAVHAWRLPSGSGTVGTGSGAEALASHAGEVLATVLRTEETAHPRVPVQQEAVEGPTQHVLLRAAERAGLVVLGARRRPHGVRGLQLGPVHHAVLQRAPCPVAVVPRA